MKKFKEWAVKKKEAASLYSSLFFRTIFLGDFSAESTHENIRFLKNCPKGSWRIDRGGKLLPEKRSIYDLSQKAFHRIFPFIERAKKEYTLTHTFRLFLSPLCHPIDPKKIDLIAKKKIEAANQILSNIKHTGKISEKTLSLLKTQIKQYEMSSISQRLLAKKAHLAAKKDSRHPLIKLANSTLENQCTPKRSTKGASGAYFIHQNDKEIAIFKPFDEEIYGPNNPGKMQKLALGHQGPFNAWRIGDSPHREVAAYLIDKQLAFNLVPTTIYAEFEHEVFFQRQEHFWNREKKKKIGSLQEFKHGLKMLGSLKEVDMCRLDIDIMHKLYLFDLIIGNRDRHLGNILTDGKKIIAIDHGLAFPCFYQQLYPAPFKLPQAYLNFSLPLIKKMLDINPFEMGHFLKKESLLPITSIERVPERLVLLQEAIKEKIKPFQLAYIFSHRASHDLVGRKTSLRERARSLVLDFLERSR